MFGFGKRQMPQVEAAVETAVIIPFPDARVPEQMVETATQHSYEELAASLGFEPAALVLARLLAFFKHEDIKLYDHDQVSTWLSHKKEEASKPYWCWRPLRKKDVIKNYVWGTNEWGRAADDGYYTSKDWACRPYDLLVPRHALEKVAKIEKSFGDKVKFFVSDFADPNADPFIMVRPAMHDSGPQTEYQLIFDAWDEPGFGEEK